MKQYILVVLLTIFLPLVLIAQSREDLFALGRAVLKEDPFLIKEIQEADIRYLGQAWIKQEPYFLLQIQNKDLKNLGQVILKKDSAYLAGIKDKAMSAFGLAWLRGDINPLQLYQRTPWYNLALGLFKRDLSYLR